MLALTLVCQLAPAAVHPAASAGQPDVVAVGAEYLRIISWNFVATGLIFTCSGCSRPWATPVPSLLSSASRLLTFALPAFWLSTRAGLQLIQVWHLSVATVALQALTSLWLLRREFRRKLVPPPSCPSRSRPLPGPGRRLRPLPRKRPARTSAPVPGFGSASGKDWTPRRRGRRRRAAGGVGVGCRSPPVTARGSDRGGALHAGAGGHGGQEALRRAVVAGHRAGDDLLGAPTPGFL